MKITIIGAGNSGLAMAAHTSLYGNEVTLWNRTDDNINRLRRTRIIKSEGVIKGSIKVYSVTSDIEEALSNPDVILITTPANSHKELAKKFAKSLKKNSTVILNPGRTFGAYDFLNEYRKNGGTKKIVVAETQTIIYTCRKIDEDCVNILAFKESVLLSTFDASQNKEIIDSLPSCLKKYFKPAQSIIETSIGNVGMILHCTPLLLNSGWTECRNRSYKYYYDGISLAIGNFIEQIDKERIEVSKKLGLEVETTKEWLKRIYKVDGNNIYECIQNNEAYRTIDAPHSLRHRYILEDVPCGLVPIESVGEKYGISMKHTSMIIDLASSLLNIDFRENGRNINKFYYVEEEIERFLKY